MCLGFVQNYAGFVAVRGILGVAEGGLLPGMVCQSLLNIALGIVLTVTRCYIYLRFTDVKIWLCGLVYFIRPHLCRVPLEVSIQVIFIEENPV